MKREQLTQVRQILTNRFSDGELRNLCFDLGVDYESLPGEGKADKARELVLHCERHGRIPELIETGQHLREDIPWGRILGGIGRAPTASPLGVISDENASEPSANEKADPSGKTSETLPVSDLERLGEHFKLFDRAAFRTPCINQLDLRTLNEAVDVVKNALATGYYYSLYGKEERIPTKNDYRSPEFRDAFGKIVELLDRLKNKVAKLDKEFRRAYPGESFNYFFTDILDSVNAGYDEDTLGYFIGLMDGIDEERNAILLKWNQLTGDRSDLIFPLIEPTSKLINWDGPLGGKRPEALESVETETPGVAPVRGQTGPWSSGLFYLVAFVVGLAVIAFVATSVPLVVLPVVIIGALLALGVIGALQLKQDERLSEENFVTLIIESYKRLPLLRGGSSSEQAPVVDGEIAEQDD